MDREPDTMAPTKLIWQTVWENAEPGGNAQQRTPAQAQGLQPSLWKFVDVFTGGHASGDIVDAMRANDTHSSGAARGGSSSARAKEGGGAVPGPGKNKAKTKTNRRIGKGFKARAGVRLKAIMMMKGDEEPTSHVETG